jgi:hypothetical protein
MGGLLLSENDEGGREGNAVEVKAVDVNALEAISSNAAKDEELRFRFPSSKKRLVLSRRSGVGFLRLQQYADVGIAISLNAQFPEW